MHWHRHRHEGARNSLDEAMQKHESHVYDFLLDWLQLVLACINFKRQVKLISASGYSLRKWLSLWPSLDNLYSGWWVAMTSTQKKKKVCTFHILQKQFVVVISCFQLQSSLNLYAIPWASPSESPLIFELPHSFPSPHIYPHYFSTPLRNSNFYNTFLCVFNYCQWF